ncbi:YVTN family beta-propeller repeat protein [Ferruginibacter sp.]
MMRNYFSNILTNLLFLLCFYDSQAQNCILNQPAHQIICNDSITNPVNFTGGGIGTVYNWTNNTPSIGLTSSGSGNIASFAAINSGNSPVTATINVTASSILGGSFAYIPLTSFTSGVSVISLATNSVVTTIPTPVGPLGVSLNADGSRAYITCRNSNVVLIINTITNTVLNTINVGTDPIGVWPSPDGSKLYVSNSTANSLSVINLNSNSVVATIPVGTNPCGVNVSLDGGRVYVANRFSNNVTVIDAATNSVLTNIIVGATPIGICLNTDGSRLYVSNQQSNTISVINTATNLVVATISVGTNPTGLATSHDGARLYVANQNSNTLSVINTTLNTVIATIPTTGLSAYGVSVSPDDKIVFVTSFNSNNISVINTVTNSLVTTISLSSSPWGLGNFITPGCTSSTTSFTITVNPKNHAACNNNTINGDSLYIKLLPNVISGNTILRVTSNYAAQINWNIYDAIGRKVMQFLQPISPGQNNQVLRLDFLAKGAYFLRGTTNRNKYFTLRLLRL